jgi:hypothetical protein
MDGMTIGLLLAVYALILWVLVFWVWQRGYREWKKNLARRPRAFRARVSAKREDKAEGERESAYFVTFESTWARKEYRVSPSAYADLQIGRVGTLHVAGDRFEDFVPQPTDEKWEAHRRTMRS